MKWHPPIPAGALWTEDALKIGPALSLLGYCYDKVGRDGSVRLNLHEAAGDMGVPYPTVKRWWDALNKTTYIASYRERGRIGMDVQMAKDWLDWRYAIGTETRSEMIPNGANRDVIGTETRSEMIPIASAYKVLISTDQAESIGGSEDQDRTARTHPPAVAILFDIFPGAAISEAQSVDLCAIDNLALWREVLRTWHANGYKPRIGNLLDRYTKELAHVKPEKEHRNGKHLRSGAGQHSERGVIRETDLDDGF